MSRKQLNKITCWQSLNHCIHSFTITYSPRDSFAEPSSQDRSLLWIEDSARDGIFLLRLCISPSYCPPKSPESPPYFSSLHISPVYCPISTANTYLDRLLSLLRTEELLALEVNPHQSGSTSWSLVTLGCQTIYSSNLPSSLTLLPGYF